MLVAGGAAAGVIQTSAELFDPGAVPDPTRQPTLGGVTALLNGTNALVATGSNFEPDLEASGGGTNNSATNSPLLLVQRIDNGRSLWVAPDETSSRSNTAFASTSSGLSGFPDGSVLVTAFVNGIPSAGQITTVFVPAAPGSPLGAAATGGPTQATVTFSPPSSSGSSVITGYTVTSIPSGGVDSDAGSTSLTHVVTGLTDGVSYAFTVTATNAVGTSPSSSPTNSVTPAPTPTPTPTPPAWLAGQYFGAFPNSQGSWAINLGADGAGTLVAFVTGSRSAIVLGFTVNSGGSISATGSTGQSGGAVHGPGTSPRTAGSISGTISSGQVSGQVNGLTLLGSRDAASGPVSALSGYYTATALYSNSGQAYTIVGPSGNTLSVIVTPASSDMAAGTTGTTGVLTATTAAGSALTLNVNGQNITESVTYSGTVTPLSYIVAFQGLNASIVPAVRLVNLSVRGSVGAGPNILITGFVTSGTGSKSMLIRGIGPTLASFGVTGVLSTPQLTLFNSAGASIYTDAAWGGSSVLSQAFSQVGAFALPAGSADSALLETLAVGSYTAQLSGTNGASGVALTELYDADASGQSSSRLVNISARGFVGTGDNILIAGFVISGNVPETILIRGVGPTLALFGLSGTLGSPQIALYDGNGNLIASNTVWGGSAALSSAFAQAGAFALPPGSQDSVLLENLPPGAYTVQFSGALETTGVGLIEVYEVPQ